MSLDVPKGGRYLLDRPTDGTRSVDLHFAQNYSRYSRLIKHRERQIRERSEGTNQDTTYWRVAELESDHTIRSEVLTTEKDTRLASVQAPGFAGQTKGPIAAIGSVTECRGVI